MKIILTFLLLILTFQVSFGQEKPKAILIDVAGQVNNDSLSSRVDNLKISLGDTDKSYIVINSEESDQIYKYKMERRILKCSELSPRLKNKVFVLFDNSKNENSTEFWQVPEGAPIPSASDSPKNFVVSKSQKETLIHSTSFENEYCHLHFDLEFYSKFLLANPNLIGKIKVYAKNKNQVSKTAFKLIQNLTKKFKVPRNQIQIFYRLNWNTTFNYEDYFLVSKRRKS
ncbi:MAG TPA: hypothetical protein PKY82_16965 [Pyrinomonadaceae bacterium]|nr:hypothetical protein [Pyrinomonadaceae bacterium]